MVAEINEKKTKNQRSNEALESINTKIAENRNSSKTWRLSSKKLKKRVSESYKPRSLPKETKVKVVIKRLIWDTKNSLFNSSKMYKKNNPFIATTSSNIGTHLGYLMEKMDWIGFI